MTVIFHFSFHVVVTEIRSLQLTYVYYFGKLLYIFYLNVNGTFRVKILYFIIIAGNGMEVNNRSNVNPIYSEKFFKKVTICFPRNVYLKATASQLDPLIFANLSCIVIAICEEKSTQY